MAHGVVPPPSTPPLQILGVSAYGSATSATSIPHAIAALPTGTLLRGVILNRNPQGQFVLRTEKGDLALQTEIVFKRGMELMLRLEKAQNETLGKILTVDGRPLAKYIESQSQQLPPEDSIAQNAFTRQPSTPPLKPPVEALLQQSGNASQPAPPSPASGGSINARMSAILLNATANPAFPSNPALPPMMQQLLQQAAPGMQLAIKIVQLQLPSASAPASSFAPSGMAQPAPIMPPSAMPAPAPTLPSASVPVDTLAATLQPSATAPSATVSTASAATPLPPPASSLVIPVPPAPAAAPFPTAASLPLPPLPPAPGGPAPNAPGLASLVVASLDSPTPAPSLLPQTTPPAPPPAASSAAPPPVAAGLTAAPPPPIPSAASTVPVVPAPSPAPVAVPPVPSVTTPAVVPAAIPAAAPPTIPGMAVPAAPAPVATEIAPPPAGHTPVAGNTTTAPPSAPPPALPAPVATPLPLPAPTAGTTTPPLPATTHPVQTPPPAATPQGSAPPVPPPILNATVLEGNVATGLTLHSPLGILRLLSPAPLPPGTQIQFEIEYFQPPSTPLSAHAGARSAGESPALRELLELPLPTAAPHASLEIPALYQPHALPRPGKEFATELVFLMSALKGGDMRKWLGEDTLRRLQEHNHELLKQIGTEFSAMRRTLGDEAEPARWTLYQLPVAVNAGLVEPMRFFHREQGDHESEPKEQKHEGGQHFIVDIQFTRLGRLQLDGFVKKQPGARQRFDLVIRSEHTLEGDLKQGIRQIFQDAGAVTGFEGALSFLEGREALFALPATATPPLAQDGQSIVV